MPEINLNVLETVFNHMAVKGVPYVWGAKAPGLTCDTNKITGIDCSGFTRYAIAKATSQKLIIPDGSAMQHAWAENNLEEVKYSLAANDALSRLFIAFMEPVPGIHAGHVWFVNDGTTMESHGGVGIDSRPWNTRVLLNEVATCFILPTVKGS